MLDDYSTLPNTIQMLFPPSRNQSKRVRELAKTIANSQPKTLLHQPKIKPISLWTFTLASCPLLPKPFMATFLDGSLTALASAPHPVEARFLFTYLEALLNNAF